MYRLLIFASLCAIILCAAPHSIAGKTSAGFYVLSSDPADGSVNVATGNITVSLTFNDVVDTTTFTQQGNKGPSGGLLGDVDSMGTVTFSADHKTVNIPVHVSASKAYFLCLYGAKSPGSGPLTIPYAVNFTTAASFPPYVVAGNVNSGTTGVSPAYSIVALSTVPLTGEGNPVFAAGAVAGGDGSFIIPDVAPGTYYPIAARDLNNDGQIDPNSGDVVGIGNPVTITSTNATGVQITFLSASAYSFADALDSLTAALPSFPSPRVLRSVQGDQIDSTGRAGGWEFFFTTGSPSTSFSYRLQTFGGAVRQMDPNTYNNFSQWDPITAASNPLSALPTSAAVDSFLARAERGGGAAYRPVPMTWNGFDVEFFIGDVYWGGFMDMVPDSSKFYLGIQYWYGIQMDTSSVTIKARRVLGDWTTGGVLGSSGVAPKRTADVASRFSLEQNYPNPFNPATIISFTVPSFSQVRLEVYDILGRLVTTLLSQEMASGTYKVRWDGTAQNGVGVSSGVYFYRIQAGSSTAIRKMLLLK
ncbi:MAG TPA: T9SS type A sorting domain-containing protein [Bacteroidota bacterium]|nr:T9SS type A sorting domain-containing protein [Bacteroidota bacterium]